MLYEFHRVENSSRPNSVNATYVVTGIQQKQEKLSSKRSQAKDGDDEIMQSSPFTSSQMLQEDELADSPQVTAITLVREEELAGIVYFLMILLSCSALILLLQMRKPNFTQSSPFSSIAFNQHPCEI